MKLIWTVNYKPLMGTRATVLRATAYGLRCYGAKEEGGENGSATLLRC